MVFFTATSPIVLVSVMTAVMSSLLLRRRPLRSNKPADLRRHIPSPRNTLLPSLSQAQADTLPYPPNHFPDPRDVETHYGSMRVYEWGPEHGAKVLLIHGDTTPGPMLGPVACELVNKGCRVMIIGLSTSNSIPTMTVSSCLHGSCISVMDERASA